MMNGSYRTHSAGECSSSTSLSSQQDVEDDCMIAIVLSEEYAKLDGAVARRLSNLEPVAESTDDVAEVTSKLSTFQLDKVSASPPALKLLQLFSLTPNSHKRLATAAQISQIENFSERKPVEQPKSTNLPKF